MTTPPSTDPRPTPPRRVGAPDKHKQVIDAAVELFLANGFDQTSMDAIASRAGVSKTTVYAHYPDKVALFRAVVERSSRSLAVELDEERVAQEGSPERRLTQMILGILEATTQVEFLAFLRVMIMESARHPDLAQIMRASEPLDVLGLIGKTLEEEATSRGYELVDSRAFATLLLRMAASSPQLDSLTFADFTPNHTLLEAHAAWVVSIFLRGIEPRPGTAAIAAPPTTGYDYPWLPDGIERPSDA